MATWKKVIVSGSNAHLTGITSSVLTNDNLLIAGNVGQIENSGLTYNGTTLAIGGANITSTGTNSVLTGSFAGTFSGSLSVNLQDLTQGTGITAFTYDGNSPATVAVSGASALSTNKVTKWTGAAFADTTITDNGSIITTTTPLSVGGAITASALDVQGIIIQGQGTNATNLFARAYGLNTTASGQYSNAEGGLSQALGSVAHAEGQDTIALGNASHAEGVQTIASGSGAHAEGNNTIARGNGSHAEGNETLAVGLSSHAEGYGTIANGDYQHTTGQFNITSSAQSAFIIGNGADDSNRSNLLFASGSEIQITGSLKVTGSISGSSLFITGNTSVGGNVTLGDASADTVTVNAQTLTLANQLAVGALSSTMLVITSSNRVATQTLGAGVATFLNTPSSANLAAAVTDETGTGTLVFSASPTFTGAVTASIISASSGITGSLFGTSSWATNALTASNIFPAITNNTDNRVLTATGGGTINGEANLTFDGSTLTNSGTTTLTGRLTANGAITTTTITASGAISSSAGLLGTTLTATSNATIGGTLGVTGATTLTGALTGSAISASGNISGSTLHITSTGRITGNTTLGGTLDVTGNTTLTGDLAVNGNTTLGNATGDTLIISGSSISVPSIGAGTTDTVIIRTATNTLATRTIDTRVWGSTLVDASGTPVANQVPYWTDANTLAGEAGFTYNPSTDVFTAPNVVVTSNLTVQGTASFQNTTNLEVADRFILLASGSNTAGEGGIVVQQATQNVGEIFGWDNDALRWAVTSSFTANQSSFTPDAFMAAVTTAAGTTPSVAARYSAVGNIYVSSGDESIWIYS